MSGISLPYIVTPSTLTGLTPILPNEVLGNVSSASAIPIGISQTELTSLINPVSTSAKGVLNPISGLSSDYIGGDGTPHALIIPPPTPPPTWTLVQTLNPTSGASLTIQNLDNYQELWIIVVNMTISAAGQNFNRLNWSFSANNGSTFVNTIAMISMRGGAITGQTNYPTGSDAQTSIYATMRISAFNQAMVSPFFTSGTTDFNESVSGFVNSATALNAIRIAPAAASPTILSGTIYVLSYG